MSRDLSAQNFLLKFDAGWPVKKLYSDWLTKAFTTKLSWSAVPFLWFWIDLGRGIILHAGKLEKTITISIFWALNDSHIKNFFVQIILFEIDWAIFYTNLHELFCQFISWTNWVNSGKFMDNYWITRQLMADILIFFFQVT